MGLGALWCSSYSSVSVRNVHSLPPWWAQFPKQPGSPQKLSVSTCRILPLRFVSCQDFYDQKSFTAFREWTGKRGQLADEATGRFLQGDVEAWRLQRHAAGGQNLTNLKKRNPTTKGCWFVEWDYRIKGIKHGLSCSGVDRKMKDDKRF